LLERKSGVKLPLNNFDLGEKMTDLNKLSLPELRKLKSAVEREIDKRSNQSKKSLHKKIRELAAAEGLDINDVSSLLASHTEAPVVKKPRKPRSATPKAAKTSTVEPKYFNQIDPSKTWSGRGRKPDWVVTWLENGGSLEKLTQRPF